MSIWYENLHKRVKKWNLIEYKKRINKYINSNKQDIAKNLGEKYIQS